MGGIEQGRPEGIGTPENLTTPELLNLVEAQLWIKFEHEEEWCYSDYSPEVLLDAVGEKVPLSEESQKLLVAQVDNLERTRKKVWGILETGNSPQEILSLAFPEFEDPPEPLEMKPTPYSLHFLFDDSSWRRFERLIDEANGHRTGLSVGISSISTEIGIPISARRESSSVVTAEHELVHDCFEAFFPSKRFSLTKLYEDFDCAVEVLEAAAKDELIVYADDTEEDFLPRGVPENVWEMVHKIWLERNRYENCDEEKLSEFQRRCKENKEAIKRAAHLVPDGRLPFLVANLEFGEILERLPEAAELYEEERKRREAEEKAFSHLAVSGGLSAVASLGACLGPWMWGAVAVFMSALGNDTRRVIKHDEARKFTFLEELGE